MKRILLLADRPGWAFDIVARALAKRLAPAIEAEISYSEERPELDSARYDLLHVFFWGQRWHQRRFSDPHQVMKELSSHRFEYESQYGPHTPAEAVDRFMRDAGTLVATSQRLYDRFLPVHDRVRQYRLGVDTDIFRVARCLREGPIRICWVGNKRDPLKGIDDLLLPASQLAEFQIWIPPGNLSQAQMANFYRSFDVLAISSLAEGTPLPLLEAMACGLWIVSTDVGVVSELVSNGENGRIVPREPKAFADALREAAAQPLRTRELGRANAALIRSGRTWDHSAALFRDIVEEAVAFRSEARRLPAVQGYKHSQLIRKDLKGRGRSAWLKLSSYRRQITLVLNKQKLIFLNRQRPPAANACDNIVVWDPEPNDSAHISAEARISDGWPKISK